MAATELVDNNEVVRADDTDEGNAEGEEAFGVCDVIAALDCDVEEALDDTDGDDDNKVEVEEGNVDSGDLKRVEAEVWPAADVAAEAANDADDDIDGEVLGGWISTGAPLEEGMVVRSVACLATDWVVSLLCTTDPCVGEPASRGGIDVPRVWLGTVALRQGPDCTTNPKQ